jgi:ATP-dependent helicase HepA
LKMKRGRDRLLELNSFNRAAAARVIEGIQKVDAEPLLRRLLLALLDHFGVRITEHEGGDVFLDPSHAYIEGFPSIPADGMLATFSRERATVREDIAFVTPDHPLVRDATDLLLESKAGTTAFGFLPSDAPNLLLEAVFVIEPVAESRWHVDQFLAPTPVRMVVDLRGNDLSATRTAGQVAAGIQDGDLHRFMDRRAFDPGVIKSMLEAASTRAGEQSRAMKAAADAAATAALGAELQRLLDLRKVNDHIRPEEIALAREQLERTRAAIAEARLRLDAMRLIVEGPAAGLNSLAE